jgi:hypothetical protein
MPQTKGRPPAQFAKFRELTKRIVAVPKTEIDKRASADKRGPVVKPKPI